MFTQCARVVVVALACLSSSVFAGELVLKNGDRVQGVLSKFEGNNVVWASDSFGDITVAKELVADLQSGGEFVLAGSETSCTDLQLNGTELSYQCGRGARASAPLQSLVDVQSYQAPVAPSWAFTGKALLSGSYDRGNKVKDELDADIAMAWEKEDWRHSVLVDYDSDSSNDESTVETYRLSYASRWFFSDDWYWYGEAFAGVDDAKDIAEQYGLGSGLGYQVWESDTSGLFFEGGLISIKENLNKPDDWVAGDDFDGSNDRTSWKGSSDYYYEFSFGRFFNKNQYVQAFEDSGNWQLETDTGLAFPLLEVLTGEVKFEYDVDNQPGEGNRREDKKLSFGVGYAW